MLSRYLQLKNLALGLRTKGNSIGDIERKLGIPRSTLSGWFKTIKLNERQKKTILNKWKLSLARARLKAAEWHIKQKEERIKKAKSDAEEVLNLANFENLYLLEIALAMLYLGEGSKTNITSLANTKPFILIFFINALKLLYSIDISQIRCELHLRSDQNKNKMINFWSEQLNIPKSRFTAIKDKRKVKTKTYSNYMGVCVVRCGNIALQRRLVFIGEGFCNKIATMRTLSSVG